MTQSDVIQKMQGIFDDLFLEPPQLSAELTAKEVPEWDSLLHINIIVAVEKAFAVRFRVGEVEGTKNVGEFADLIVKRLSGD